MQDQIVHIPRAERQKFIHTCQIPYANQYALGTYWQCGSCRKVWKVVYGTYAGAHWKHSRWGRIFFGRTDRIGAK